ncbi:ubiquitin-conjugating enzyme/RWD-like protein [Ephemerocybe angulata]|uniref:Ubiquitin-conjugating enzyme/RWD-like protein n=1 Tax=Ephemerocybe angulata TaxID=980116 RepID=A0A8H6MEA7_9AGAR|nr:ubiquitin-conjugating enzyme/RWD-like protein [Tulosesus angulatus]
MSSDQTSYLVARTTISVEYAALMGNGHCPLGMYVIPSPDNLFVWDVVFFVHQGYYAGAILKFRVTFPENYPEGPPSVRFVTEVFHPLISQDGDFALDWRFRPWRPKEHHIFDILHSIKSAFKMETLDKLRGEDCINKEAFRYKESAQSFASLATQSVHLSESESALFDRDHHNRNRGTPHSLQFQKINSEQMRQVNEKLGLQPGTKA